MLNIKIQIMKNPIILFVFGMALFMAGCSEDNLVPNDQPDIVLKSANVPVPNVVGIMDLTLSPTSPTNLWNGTIDFGDHGKYSIAFFTLTPPPEEFRGVYLFDEEFIIYKLGTDWTVTENIVLKGFHKGRLVFANKFPESVKFNANGKITEAYAPFEMCMGRTEHSKGPVFFNTAPPSAVLVMRIN